MLKTLNKNNQEINIVHFCGQSLKDFKITVPNIFYNSKLSFLNIPIISCWTNENDCILLKQLLKFNINIINAVPKELKKEWEMPDKINYILSALKNIEDDVVLILDGYDVLFTSTNNILNKFKELGYKILYNATANNYPIEEIDIIENRDSYGKYKYFNAGCCIGYRKDLIKFYTEALKYINIENPLKSEQKILRYAFSKYSNNPNQRFIGIDYNSIIFQTMGRTKVDYNKDTQILKISPIE